MTSASLRRQSGFTLLEMLAALTVLALCFTVLLGAFGQSARALQQARHSDRLNLAARSLLEELGEGALQPGSTAGNWDGLPWTLEVQEQPVPAGAVRLLRLNLTVREGTRLARFSTLRALGRGVSS
jgi:general secretion pathway protein I